LNAISFDRVVLGFGGREVLSDVSFDIPEGSFTGVLGPNGAGKTTLMRAILGLLRPAAGSIEVMGEKPRRGDARIGYMPQQRRVDPDIRLNARQYLLASAAGKQWGWPFLSADLRQAVDIAIDSVGGAELADRPLCDLSGGQRQRLFIAQAMLREPRLLVLDEPLISLDPGHQRSVVELVGRLSRERGITVLFSAHEINPILPAVDTVLYLGGGHAATGPVDAVINNETLSRLYGTPVHVARSEGRLFVLAQDCEIHSHLHDHEVDARPEVVAR